MDEGFRWLKKLATSSYPEAQYFLGTQYAQDGEYDKGFALWLQASKHNHPGSCYEAGRCYELGLGTKKDARRAQQFYVKSASAGYVPAMYRLGVAALHGECGFRKDPKEAIKWLKRGSAASDAQSSYTLSGIYETGAPPSIYADEAYAKSLLEEAAEKGWAPAQAKLGVCYEYGKVGSPLSNFDGQPSDILLLCNSSLAKSRRSKPFDGRGWLPSKATPRPNFRSPAGTSLVPRACFNKVTATRYGGR